MVLGSVDAKSGSKACGANLSLQRNSAYTELHLCKDTDKAGRDVVYQSVLDQHELHLLETAGDRVY